MQLAPVMRSKLMRPKLVKYAALLSSVLLGVAVSSVQQGLTQSAPTCDPPGANEYLLLVINQQLGTEEQLRQLLPENAVIVSCHYLDDPVVRVGGFANAEIAEAWAKYVTDTAGLQAFVAGSTADTVTATATTPSDANSAPADESLAFPTPTQTPSAEATSSPPTGTTTAQDATSELPSLNQAPDTTVTPDSNTPDSSATPSTPPPSPNATAPSPNPSTPATGSSPNPVFAPKPLGSGYAVLVNYANRPEVAADVQQVTSQPVGLVSYNQRPFLLATHTTDPTAATAVLQSLNDRGFNAILIDSRSAVLLTPAVVGTGG